MSTQIYSYKDKADGAYDFIRDVFGGSTAYYHIKGSGNSAYVDARRLIAADGDLVIRDIAEKDAIARAETYAKRNGVEMEVIDAYPRNLKISTCGFVLESEKKPAASEIIMVHIRLDHDYTRGAFLVAEEEKFLALFEEEVLKPGQIPVPTYYVLDGKISLIYLFEEKILLPIKAREKKKLIEAIETQAGNIVNTINSIDHKCGATFKSKDYIYLPGVRHREKRYTGKDKYGKMEFKVVCDKYVRAHKRGTKYTLEEFLNASILRSQSQNQVSYGKSEMLRFLSILMHDRRGAYVGISIFGDEVVNDVPNTSFYTDINEIKLTKRDLKFNCYACLHPLKLQQAVGENVFCYNAFFIDLDAHQYEGDEQLRIINSARIALTYAFMSGRLVCPTMMTYTGGGLGLFYVLQQSMPANSAKATWLYFKTWVYLSQYITEFLKENDLDIEVDTEVISKARLCRLPGSINQKNQRRCKLIMESKNDDGQPLYWQIDELMERIGFAERYEVEKQLKQQKCMEIQKHQEELRAKKRTGKKTEQGEEQTQTPAKMRRNVGNHIERGGKEYSPHEVYNFNCRRVYHIINYLEACDYDCEGHRELALFILYNSLYGLFSPERAMRKLQEINQMLKSPLSEKEMKIAFESVEKNFLRTGELYHLYDDWVINALNASFDMQVQMGLGKPLRNLIMAEKSYILHYERDCEYAQLARLVLENPKWAYAEIAETIDRSEVWVRKILRQMGYRRNKKGSEECGKILHPVTPSKPRKIVVADLLEM